MGQTIIGTFPTRRAVELTVEHLVQDYGLERTDIMIEPVGSSNTAGTHAAGADVESGHDGIDTAGEPALEGAIEVSVDMNDDEIDAVMKAFGDAGATAVRTR